MSDAGQPGWPNGVRPILVPDLKRLGINEQNELFWDGRHVEIRRSLTLTRFQKSTLPDITEIDTALQAIGRAATFGCGDAECSEYHGTRPVVWAR